MTLIIKVLKSGTAKPSIGASVSLKRPGIIGNEQPTKSTGSDGLVRFDLRPCNAIISINNQTQSERVLKDGENIFYI